MLSTESTLSCLRTAPCSVPTTGRRPIAHLPSGHMTLTFQKLLQGATRAYVPDVVERVISALFDHEVFLNDGKGERPFENPTPLRVMKAPSIVF